MDAARSLADPEFLHALLHDLKGPVARVRMLGELLERRQPGLDPETVALLGHIRSSAEAAEEVLEGVRRYAEAARRPYRPSQFDLTAALENALVRLRSQIAEIGASVKPDSLPRVYADMAQLSTLFEELIGNALQFHSIDPPVIEIAAIAEDSDWVISVADNGSGLGGAAAQRLFRPFGKASPRSGAGMGLAICRLIADAHGGEITVFPRQRGTEFRLRLPRSRGSTL